jgi:catechol 2,3-dioxygenase-like lactoylglutathione lyase family enzyme
MAEPQPARPILGVHHAAFRCRDAEQTIWFYRDVLGLADPTGIVLEERPGTGSDDPYMHLFFRMKNGEFIAFFDAPGSATPDSFGRKDGFDLHWAFEVESEEALIAMRDRLNALGIPAFGPLDHGFVRSVYMFDPNGLPLELTYRVENHDSILDEEERKFPDMLAVWTERTRAQKEAKFGADALARESGAAQPA